MIESIAAGVKKPVPVRERNKNAGRAHSTQFAAIATERKSPGPYPPRWVAFAWGIATLAVVAALLGFAWQRSRPITKPIGEVRVGDRVKAHNPELSGFAQTIVSDITADTWRHLKLRMKKADGGRLDIELLRPVSWIEVSGAVVGSTINLEMEELGAVGPAEVLSIEDCPPIAIGNGRIVTGTFRHESANLLDIYVDGLASPIGVTASHPFWSDDRQAFVSASELRRGERLRSLDRGGIRIDRIVSRKQVSAVFNLEVDIAHTYSVSLLGIIVHNNCSKFADLTKTDTIIYRVVDPATQKTVYVGQVNAAKGMDKRLTEHFAHPKKSHWKGGDYEIEEVARGNWTPFEAHSHEMRTVVDEGGMEALENVKRPITPTKFEAYKDLHADFPDSPHG